MMEELLKNWKEKLKDLKSYQKMLYNEYAKTGNEAAKKSFDRVTGKIEVLEKCIKLEKF
ncbi:MAG: hypothetical protein IJF92_00795 [Bacilli bacterium]|nr:hypothetical protein [Bacilli bacterium]MBQ3307648.1 hypothetical protein [Bacilli bacterium]